jgi:hypothetical protein
MSQYTLFHRMLGIPDTSTDPTPHELLGLRHGRLSDDEIQAALNERSKLIRQRLPNQQFIPLALSFEHQLKEAAAALQSQRPRATTERRRSESRPATTVDEPRTALSPPSPSSTSTSPLTPPPASPPAPPMVPPLPSVENDPGASTDVSDYFRKAVRLTIVRGSLRSDDESILLDLADRFGLSREVALDGIARELEPNARPDGTLDTPELRKRFEKQVRKFAKQGEITPEERDGLRKFAAAQGLARRVADDILRRCLGQPAAPPTAVVPTHVPQVEGTAPTLDDASIVAKAVQRPLAFPHEDLTGNHATPLPPPTSAGFVVRRDGGSQAMDWRAWTPVGAFIVCAIIGGFFFVHLNTSGDSESTTTAKMDSRSDPSKTSPSEAAQDPKRVAELIIKYGNLGRYAGFMEAKLDQVVEILVGTAADSKNPSAKGALDALASAARQGTSTSNEMRTRARHALATVIDRANDAKAARAAQYELRSVFAVEDPTARIPKNIRLEVKEQRHLAASEWRDLIDGRLPRS